MGLSAGTSSYKASLSSRVRRFLTCRRTRIRIDCVNEVALIAALVLHEQHILAIAAPEVAGNWPSGVRGDWSGFVEGFCGALHPKY